MIATAQALDEEMAARIARHQAERGAGWTTREAPLELVAALPRRRGRGGSVLVDCVTLWLSNLLLAERDMEAAIAELAALVAALARAGDVRLQRGRQRGDAGLETWPRVSGLAGPRQSGAGGGLRRGGRCHCRLAAPAEAGAAAERAGLRAPQSSSWESKPTSALADQSAPMGEELRAS